jgi:hypothetical protein
VSAFALAALVLACAARGENRLWYVDLELRGACEAVRLDCGADGETRLAGPFSPGEDRRFTLPVPVRSPLGAQGLAAVPLPRAQALPAGAAAEVRVLGWSVEQPAGVLEREARLLLARQRPPSAGHAARAGWVELALVLAAGGFLLALRRRLVPALVLALGVSGLAFGLTRARAGGSEAVELVDWEAGAASALGVHAAAERLALPRAGLEVTPEGCRIEFELSRDGRSGTASATRAALAALELVPPPPLSPGQNGSAALAEAWTRTARGDWRAHGPWPSGAPLPVPATDPRSDPPGWLASGLPPGRGVLLARTEAGAWLRCLGFALE